MVKFLLFVYSCDLLFSLHCVFVLYTCRSSLSAGVTLCDGQKVCDGTAVDVLYNFLFLAICLCWKVRDKNFFTYVRSYSK